MSLYDIADLCVTFIGCVAGDPACIVKMTAFAADTGMTALQKLPYLKLKKYLDGVKKAEDDYGEACDLNNKLFSDPDRINDNAMRIIQYVTTSDTEKKIDYYVNATRSLLLGFIDAPTMFRIFAAINSTLQEDLEFLAEHIEDKTPIRGNIQINALSQNGLMLMAGIDPERDVERQNYEFSSLAQLVDRYAVSLDNEKRQRWYENNITVHKLFKAPDPKTLSKDELDEIFEQDEYENGPK